MSGKVDEADLKALAQEWVSRGSGASAEWMAKQALDLLAALEQERARVGVLEDAVMDLIAEIEYLVPEMLSAEERNHPRGSGWARVYDKGRAALAPASATAATGREGDE